MLRAICRELVLRADYLPEPVQTIYFGGGTPSILSVVELAMILDTVRSNYAIDKNAEITLESNPDDVDADKLKGWQAAGFNRLSMGVQSFFETDLQWMNRAHNASQAKQSLELALRYFPNMTIDLIYGTPGLTDAMWEQNVAAAIKFNVPHISCYALTVEPKTPLDKMIREHRRPDVDPDQQSAQFLWLMQRLRNAGYEHYEISNFAKPGFRSRHNSSYWQGKPYLGIGPSAHSFNGTERKWNVANNQQYIRALAEGILPADSESLTAVQQLNEYIMISLRTAEGIDLRRLSASQKDALVKNAQKYLKQNKAVIQNDKLFLTDEGKLYADGIAADLFFESAA